MALASLGTTHPITFAPVGFRAPLRLSAPSGGYHVLASASVRIVPRGADSESITAGDIGIGVRVDGSGATVARGFDYDPMTVDAPDGLTPFGGASSGRGLPVVRRDVHDDDAIPFDEDAVEDVVSVGIGGLESSDADMMKTATLFAK